jgi:hypothetical protein
MPLNVFVEIRKRSAASFNVYHRVSSMPLRPSVCTGSAYICARYAKFTLAGAAAVDEIKKRANDILLMTLDLSVPT